MPATAACSVSGLLEMESEEKSKNSRGVEGSRRERLNFKCHLGDALRCHNSGMLRMETPKSGHKRDLIRGELLN